MRSIQWIITLLLVVAGGATAWYTYQLAQLATDAPERPQILKMLLMFGIATVLLGLIQKLVDAGMLRSRKKELRAWRAQFYSVFDGPVSRLLAQIEAMAVKPANVRDVDLHSIRNSIVRDVSQLVASETARATYFQVVDQTATSRVMKGDVYNYSDSRSDNATTEFLEHSGIDEGVWKVVDGGGPSVYPNLKKQHPPDWGEKPRIYKGFMTYRVRVGRVGVGVLTVNSLKPDEFGNADQSIMNALAELLSVAEAVALSPQATRRLAAQAQSRASSVGSRL